MNSIRNLIADDSFAISFQSMGQYRTALLKALDVAPPAPAVEALARLYWWGGGTSSYGYSADVVLGVRDWIDGGMAGDLPPLPAWVADRCPPLPQAGEGG